LPWNDKSWFSSQQYLEATGPGGNKGGKSPGFRINGGVENSQQCFKYFNTVHLLRKDLSFENGGAERLSWPGRHPTLVRPWTGHMQLILREFEKKWKNIMCVTRSTLRTKRNLLVLTLHNSTLDTSVLLRFQIFVCCSQCYSFRWLIHVNVLLAAIEHCNECYLALSWFSHIASILVDYALTVKLTRHARTLQTVFALDIPV